MKQTNENQYIKRTQKDYSYAFKLAIVQEVENGELGIKAAARKIWDSITFYSLSRPEIALQNK